jgi:hypothetical protein
MIARDQALPADFGQRDRHDLRRKDEIGAHRACHPLMFERGNITDRTVERFAVLVAA